MADLIRLTAREAVRLLRERSVSPLELIDAALARIERSESDLNALPTLCEARARDRARRLMDNPPTDPPPWYLYGLPIAVKDLNDVAGVRTTYGSPIFADHIPDRTDCAVEILESNGAIVLAKSNVPEFGAGAQTYNTVFGTTTNPWDTRTTPAGSSGGSAAALAAGQVWLATGSDFGGSLRMPASFTSTVALRPGPGRVAHGPIRLPFNFMPVEGPMARDVRDLALMLDAEVGHHPDDPLSLPAPPTTFSAAVAAPRAPARVAFSPDLGIIPVDSEVRAICRSAAEAFAALGVEVVEDCPDLADAEETFSVLRAAMSVSDKGAIVPSNRYRVKPEVLYDFDRGLQLTGDEIGRAERARGAIALRAARFFRDYDLLLCPASPVPPFDHTIPYPTEIEGTRLQSYFSWLALSFAITLTACPAACVPCGFTRSGLPVGLQIVAPIGAEAKLLSAARCFEEAAGLDNPAPIDPRPAGLSH